MLVEWLNIGNLKLVFEGAIFNNFTSIKNHGGIPRFGIKKSIIYFDKFNI